MGEEFQTVCRADEIDDQQGKRVEIGGKKIAIFNVDGEFYAIDDTCTHAQASLSEGLISGQTVACPRHGARFDVKTGQVKTLPAVVPVDTYEVRLEGDEVQVKA